MTKNSDQSTEILQNTLRELGYAAYAPDLVSSRRVYHRT